MESPAYVLEWFAELSVSARRFRLILATLGHAHEPFRASIDSISGRVMSVEDYLSSRRLVDGPSLVVLSDLETVCLDSISAGKLSALRERIDDDMDRDINFVLISRFPRARYPVVPGSSLLEDAKMIFAPLAPGELGNASRDPAAVLPVYSINQNGDVKPTFRTILNEFGIELLASFDHAVFESMVPCDEIFSWLNAREAEALQGAGLAVVEGGTYAWTIPTRFGEFREALSDALAQLTDTQECLTQVFALMWSLERSIRMAMRNRALEVWSSKWRQQSLHGDLPKRVLERATGDAYAAAKSIKEIRDPFEWLTLGELLELRQRRVDFGGLGVEEAVWKKFADEVLPVRNRLSHMRLLREGDITSVRQWSRVLGRKLQC
jgi:hypothetical protein